MKKTKKFGNPGKVGEVATKPGKSAVQKTGSLAKLDEKTLGSAMGILGKHFK